MNRKLEAQQIDPSREMGEAGPCPIVVETFKIVGESVLGTRSPTTTPTKCSKPKSNSRHCQLEAPIHAGRLRERICTVTARDKSSIQLGDSVAPCWPVPFGPFAG